MGSGAGQRIYLDETKLHIHYHYYDFPGGRLKLKPFPVNETRSKSMPEVNLAVFKSVASELHESYQ